jgi:hypothetical protein
MARARATVDCYMAGNDLCTMDGRKVTLRKAASAQRAHHRLDVNVVCMAMICKVLLATAMGRQAKEGEAWQEPEQRLTVICPGMIYIQWRE